MKTKNALYGLLGLLFMAAGVTQAQAITDPVEDNDGWVVIGNPLHFLSACCGTSPTAGTTYLHIQISAAVTPVNPFQAIRWSLAATP